MSSNPAKRTKTLLLAGAMGGAALLGGTGAMVLFQPASAQTATTVAPSTDNGTPAAPAPAPGTAPRGGRPDPSKGGHQANGVTEELLTGDTAASVKAAAEAAVPGGTVERVETDAEGATYEAHVTKADGSEVTVKFDANFAVTSTEDGPR